MHGTTVHWGILCAGRICQDFVKCLNSFPDDEQQVSAVAATSLERAQVFAEENSIPRAYDSYEKLANDPNVDVIYIGSINIKHYEHTRMVINAGKAVLCEKPLCMTTSQVKSLVSLAKEKKVFLMEAVWSRFNPAYKALREAIDNDEIGNVRMVQSSFGEYFTGTGATRVVSKELGGGALFDIGIYQIQLSQFVFEEKPIEQSSTGFLNEDGVDVHSATTLKYSNNRLSSMATSSITDFPNNASVCGTKGFIKIHSPFWSPTTLTVNGHKREFPLPDIDAKFNFRNSQGLRYEAEEVRRCLLNGLIESPRITHAMSIELAEIIEKARKEMGYTLSDDE